MTIARWQATIVDAAGNIVPNCFIEVRREIAGAPLASLKSDRDSVNNLVNPFQADGEGFASFYAAGGFYKIRAYKDGFERIWRDVALGTNGGTDFATAFLPKGAWSGATTYALGDLVSRVNGGDPYAFVSNHDANLNNAPPFTGAVGTSDAHWTVVGLIEAPGSPGEPGSSDVVGTSISNLAIGTGAKAFTVVETDRGWAAGARLRAASDASPTSHWMEGVVTSYIGTALQIAVDLTSGAGNRADWTINLAGERGQAGAGIAVYQPPGGTANAITAAVLLTGSLHVFKAGAAITGSVHSFNGRPLLDKDGNALRAGAIQPNVYYLLLDDGANYYVIMSGFTI